MALPWTRWGLRPQTRKALIGFRGGEAGTEKLGCGHLVREQKWE